MDHPAPPSSGPSDPAASAGAPAKANGQEPLHEGGRFHPPPSPPATANGHGNGSGNGHSPKRGVTAAEALAAELHREIARREVLEHRLAEAEAKLAAQAATPPPPVAEPAPPAPEPTPETAERLAAAEDQLIRSEERFAYVMSSANLGFFDTTYQPDITYYSPGYGEMLGFRPDELPAVNQTFIDLLHPDDKNSEWLVEREPVGEGVSPLRPAVPAAPQGRHLPLDRKRGHGVFRRGRAPHPRPGLPLRHHLAQAARGTPAPERGTLQPARDQLAARVLRQRPRHRAVILLAALEGDARLPARGIARLAPDVARTCCTRTNAPG